MRPDQEQELLTRVRSIDSTTSEFATLMREIKMWRKFVAWAFGIASGAMAAWQFYKDFRGL